MASAKLILLLIAVSAIAVQSDDAVDSHENSHEEFECKGNEILTNCSTPCPPTCKDRVPTCDYECKTGCACKPEYIREKIDGKCIPIRDCKNDCSRNQTWQECSDNSCRRTCNNIDSPNICPAVCIPGCSCKEGYVWDEQLSKCISKFECPPQCGSNQVWSSCSDNNCQRTCSNKDEHLVCDSECIPGCSCQPGFVWDSTRSHCISVEECPKCGPDQVWEKCSDNHCKRTCINLIFYMTCAPSCIEGCSCREGFVWTDEKTSCIPVEQCPSTLIPPTTTPVPTTATPVGTTPTPASTTPTPASTTTTQPPKVCGHNQFWEQCSDKFCKRTCENINGPIGCPRVCVEGCSCMHGFVWNQNDTECIPVEDCSFECGLNQHWSQCSDIQCRRTCANFGQDVPCPQMCMSGCTCDSGYVWNSNETECIPACDCGKDVCLENEEWGSCANPECKRTCQNTNEKVCSDCFPGCVCRAGYIWDEILQECVPEDHCSGCGINANMSSCTNGCEPTCQGPSPFPCPAVCIPGCACLPGYLMDHHQGHCVLPSECSSVCPPRKTWCRHLPSNRVTCQNMLYPQCNYQSHENQTSYPGCVCKEGLILDELTNECIPLRHCLRMLR
ncbi:hypothetical protein PPYR_07998 [Photinus pyralis]|uniref:TIL domain-containing protein n=3 Tax=Photinus pyralis TaxID=7054 RepID=A0A5N4ASC1_PHOPY|nr:hypothetical protein PPYR_07998 [Photinus pyralis]